MDDFAAITDHFAPQARLLLEDPAARYGALRKCAFFEPVPDDRLQLISQMAQIRTYHSDVSITTQHEEMKAFYVILYGTAEAFRNGKLVGAIATGDCFGEGIFFGDGAITTSATVIAEDKIIVAEFSKAAVDELHADPQAMVSMDKALLLALFKKLQGANEKIAKLMLR